VRASVGEYDIHLSLARGAGGFCSALVTRFMYDRFDGRYDATLDKDTCVVRLCVRVLHVCASVH
jgi:hypothetical protein